MPLLADNYSLKTLSLSLFNLDWLISQKHVQVTCQIKSKENIRNYILREENEIVTFSW